MIAANRIGIVRGILEDMPKRFQNPKLEVRKDVNRPYYFIRVCVPGPDGKKQRVNKPLGFCDELTRKDAMKLRSEALDVVNAGRFLVQARLKFRDLVNRFLEVRLPQFGQSTQKWQRSLIGKHILPAFGDKALSDIDKPMVEAWLVGKKMDGLSWWTRKALRSVLTSIFAAAIDWKMWSGEKPSVGIWLGKKREAREKRLLSAEELRLLLAALPERPKFIVLILFGLGLRISEALGLKWSDINFEQKTITIQRRWYRGDLSEETKSEASSAVLRLGPSMLQEFRSRFTGVSGSHGYTSSPISGQAPTPDGYNSKMSALGRMSPREMAESGITSHDPARQQFIFTSDSGPMPPDDRDLLREEFRPVLKRLKLYYKGFGWHAFRRQNITWRQQIGGATPLEAQRAARHASLDMTYLYTLSDAERETAQQQKMFDMLMGLSEGKPQ